MFNKKFLGVAVAAAISGQAMAVIDIDSVTPSAELQSYATETVLGGTAVDVSGTDHYPVVDAGTNLSLQSEIGFGFPATTDIYIRVDLTGGVLQTAITAATADVQVADAASGTITQSISQGGAANDNFVIVTIQSNRAIAATDTITLDLENILVAGGNSTVNYQYRLYATAIDAAAGNTNTLKNVNIDAIATSASGAGFTVTAAAANPVANVNLDPAFSDFVTSGEQALGTIALYPVASVLAADDGLQVAVSDLLTAATSTLTISGDLSWATGVNLDSSATCANAGTALAIATTGDSAVITTSADISVAAASNAVTLCAIPDTTTAIPEVGNFAVSFAPSTGSLFPAGAGSLAGIDRNGTTLELPYVSTFADYNQRLVVTNNGSTDTTYVASFVTEAGVTATAGASATGTLKAGEVTVVKMTDMVTLAGGTRGSAKVVIPTPEANIDAAITQVNLSTGGTDTNIVK